MKILFIVYLLLFSTHSIGHTIGEEIKCQGFLNRGDEKVFYELHGKILKSLHRHYVVYGFTPVLNSKRLHRVLKTSCVGIDESFVEKITLNDEKPTSEPVATGEEDSEVVEDLNLQKIEEKKSVSQSIGQKIEKRNINQSADKVIEIPENELVDKALDVNEDEAEEDLAEEESTPKNNDKKNDNCSDLKFERPSVIFKCFIKDLKNGRF